MSNALQTSSSSTSAWPHTDTSKLVFLIDACTEEERKYLTDWLNRQKPQEASAPETDNLAFLSSQGRDDSPTHEELQKSITAGDDRLFVPIRIAWLTEDQSGGVRRPRVRDFIFRRSSGPNPVQRRWLLKRSPDKAQPIAGKAATLHEMKLRYRAKIGAAAEEELDIGRLADYVARQAILSLEQAERSVNGARQKLPYFVSRTLQSRIGFRKTITQIGQEQDQTDEQALEEAAEYLKELVALPSEFHVDTFAQLARFIYSRGYDPEIVHDPADIKRLRDLAKNHPIALCWTHKTHVDGIAVSALLHQYRFPLAHMIGGINMAFMGIGYLARRSGAIFIRRSFQDNRIYKAVLRHYIGYLMEKRFPISWSIEGTRSRIGKLMPPRFGILKYVMEAARTSNIDDLHLVPVTIYYDLIPEVADYAAEQRGQTKRPESLAWFIGYVRGMSKPLGRVSIRFGEPVVVGQDMETKPKYQLGDSTETKDAFALELQKAAFEVAVRINNVTPVTPSAIITLALLGACPRSLSIEQITDELGEIIAWMQSRGIPMTSDFGESTAERVQQVANTMIELGILTRYDEGLSPVYGIAPDQHLIAGYYRNTIVHFLIIKAFIELALVKAAEMPPGHSEAVFWNEALRLRDIFKFEFFYSSKEEFREQVQRELDLSEPNWANMINGGADQVNKLLDALRPLFAHATLKPYIEAYSIVADGLLQFEQTDPWDEKGFLTRCLKYGKQAYLQRRITSEESIAKLLYTNGVKLAGNLGLIEDTSGDLHGRRVAFARELRDIGRRIDLIDAMAARRRNTDIISVREVKSTDGQEPIAV